MTYLFLKWLHIISATVLFGTGVGSAFYLFVANRTRDLPIMYFAAKYVVIADWIFTAPAVVLQLVTGLLLVHMGGFSLTDTWVIWGLALYFFAGLCWLPVLWLQVEMRNLIARALVDGTPLPARFWRLDRWWVVLGSLAFPAIILVFLLMVYKP